MLSKLLRKLRGDFIVVFLSNLFSYGIAFSGSILYVRLLGKNDFGLYTFAFNIISLFLLFNGFGAASGILQYVSKAKSSAEQDEYLRFAFKSGSLFNLSMSLCILLYARFVTLPIPAAKPILLGMAFFPLGRLYIDVFQAYLRAKQLNRLQAKFSILNNCILLLANLMGIVCFKLYGLIYFTYLGYLIMFIYSSWKFPLPKLFVRSTTSMVKVRQFIQYSLFNTLANAFSGLVFVLDLLIISYIVKDPQQLAIYRVATIIPFALTFIPGIAVNFYYPEIARNAHNPLKVRQLARWLSIRMFIFSGLISLGLVVCAKPLLAILFGPGYTASVLPFQILSFGYWIIATFRTINGNILAALGQARLNFYLTCIVLVVNVILTYLMVVNYSINGAAVAVVLIYMFSSLIGYLALQMVIRQR